jgi:hypothetical protein
LSQLNIQQPVIQIVGRPTCEIVQELFLGFLSQDAVFDGKLVVGEFNGCDTWQQQELEFSAQFAFGIVPKEGAVFFEESIERGLHTGHIIQAPFNHTPSILC